LLLAPKNEIGIIKFICTTLRPTKLPFKELYNWEACSKFLANYMEYEELDPPDKLPEVVAAPANVLSWQAGDCFDFSILLCSLLLGNGYEAYVIYGRAPREMTSRDESMLSCPQYSWPILPTDEQEEIQPPSNEKPSQLNVEELRTKIDEPLESKFEEQLRRKIEEEKEARERAEREITDDEPEYEHPDPFKSKRLHCWVLVKRGKRDVPPSTSLLGQGKFLH
jgi:hypothetical protein